MGSLNTSQTLSDDLADYDVISESGGRSLESSLADLNTYDPSEELEFPSEPHARNSSNGGFDTAPATAHNTVRCKDRDPGSNPLNPRVSPMRGNWEPEPLQPAKDRFETARLTAEQIQDYVAKSLEESHSFPPIYGHGPVLVGKMGTVRIYVDGLFDGLNVAQSLQLRQAKLSFPQTHLIVGVFSDTERGQHNLLPLRPHVERCEIVRHCRWVDEVVPDAPWALDEEYLNRLKIDYVAVEEGSTVDPTWDKTRLKGYDILKGAGKVISTRKTLGLTPIIPVSSPITHQPIPTLVTPVQTPRVPTVNIPKREPIHERMGSGEGKLEGEAYRRRRFESPSRDNQRQPSPPTGTPAEPWIRPPSPPVREPLIAFED